MNNRVETPMDPFRAFMDATSGEPIRKSMLNQMERFWEGQKKLLDEYESFSRAMLERRRAAAESTLDTVRKMSSCADASEWAKCYGDWFAGSWTRVAEDSRDMIQEGFKLVTEVSQTMSAGLAEAGHATAETQQAAMRTASGMGEHGAASAQEAARMAAARAARTAKRPEEGARAGADD